MKDVTPKVKTILRLFPTARSSDKNLYIFYLEFFHGGVYAETIREAPPMESLSRSRRKIQEGGEFKAVDSVRCSRESNREYMSNWAMEI